MHTLSYIWPGWPLCFLVSFPKASIKLSLATQSHCPGFTFSFTFPKCFAALNKEVDGSELKMEVYSRIEEGLQLRTSKWQQAAGE